MGAELTLLTPRPASNQEWAEAATRVLGHGQIINFHGGMREILDGTDRAVLSWWPPRTIENDRLLAEVDGYTPKARGGTPIVWTDVCLIHGRERAGRAVVESLATALGGSAVERS